MYTHVYCHSSGIYLRFQVSVNSIIGPLVIYGHGGNLGHVTWIINIHIGNHYLLKLHMKFGFDWPSGFRGDV